MWQKYGWLICFMLCKEHANIPQKCSDWGWLPLIPLLYSFLYHHVMGAVKTWGAPHLSCLFSHLVNRETGIGSFTCYMSWQGVRLNRLFLASKNYDCLIISMFHLSIKGWHFRVQLQQIRVFSGNTLLLSICLSPKYCVFIIWAPTDCGESVVSAWWLSMLSLGAR